MFVLLGEVLGGGGVDLTEVRDGESILPWYLHDFEQVGESSLSCANSCAGGELMLLTLLLFPLPHPFDQLSSLMDAGVSTD